MDGLLQQRQGCGVVEEPSVRAAVDDPWAPASQLAGSRKDVAAAPIDVEDGAVDEC